MCCLAGINGNCGVTQLLVPRVKHGTMFAELMSDLDKGFFATYFYWKCHFSISTCLYWFSFGEVLLQVCKLKSSLKLFESAFLKVCLSLPSLFTLFLLALLSKRVCAAERLLTYSSMWISWCWRGWIETVLIFWNCVHFSFKTACECYPVALITRCFKASSVYCAEIK